MTKKEYCEYISESLNDEDIKKIFDCARKELESEGFWNINLQFQYDVIYAEENYEEKYGNTFEECEEEYEGNCYCDIYGYCGDTSCSNYSKCHF